MNVSDSDIRLLHHYLVQIADIKSQIERGPKQVRAANSQLESAKEAVQKCKDTIKQKKMDADRKQLSLREREAKIHDWEGKMNAAKNNREFQAIKEQIAADTQANSVLSDEILEILEEIDALQVQQKELEEKQRGADAERARLERTVAERLEVIKQDLVRVEENLATAEGKVPEEFLDAYRRLVATRAEEAMAALDDASCGGCNTGLPPRIIDKLRLGQSIPCPSCARWLYRPER